MVPNIAQLIAASAPVQALLGNPPRFYPGGIAVRNPSGQVVTPYAVWQVVYGSPENYLGDLPDMDSYGVQIDVYCTQADGGWSKVRQIAQTLRDALEPHAYVVAWRGESQEPDTNNYRYSFDVEIRNPR